jgi:hypothetical protein
MRASFRLGAAVSLLLVSLWPRPAVAQWTVGLEIGAERFWGGSAERVPPHRSFRPYRPTTLGVGLERRWGRVGFGFRVNYTEAGLGLEGEGAAATVDGVFTVYSAAPEASYRIASMGPSNELVLHVGPLIELWQLLDEESRARIGAQGAISLGIPLGGRFAGAAVAGTALISSPFKEDELPGYDLRALWRRRFAVGLQYRL